MRKIASIDRVMTGVYKSLMTFANPDVNRVEFTHKAGTRQEVVKDRLGNITVYEYDDHGRVVSETNALGYRTEYQYDAGGNKIKEIDALGNASAWTYDSGGNMTSSTDYLKFIFQRALTIKAENGSRKMGADPILRDIPLSLLHTN